MKTHRLILSLVLLAAALAARGAEAPAIAPPVESTWEQAASRLQSATVTVRIWNAPSAAAQQAESVTVCTGICVRAGYVATAAMAGSDSKIRLTLPGGKQADARLQVIDEFSGLALLRCEIQPLAPLEIAPAVPSVGSGVMTAAAWGVESPLVSLGIVAGIDRQRPGVSFPPLLQCDLRTTETSGGAAIVDRQARLLGIIVASDSPESRRGWAYAVPVSHVERLLRTADEQKGPGVTIVKRRRPIVGLVLDQDEDAILVQRVTPGGPAEKAGMQVGDIVLATDGVAIRSVYQAVLPTLYKQPGDTLVLQVQRPTGMHEVKIVLGGGVEVASAPFELLSGLMQPKIEVARDAAGNIARVGPQRTPQEAFQPPLPDDGLPPEAATPGAKIALLEKALDRYRTVIEVQQQQLAQEQKRRGEQEEALQSLRTEMESLRRQLEAAREK